MKQKIKQILNTITPQDLEEGCSRQVEEINNLINNKTMIRKIEIQESEDDVVGSYRSDMIIAKKINEIIDYLNEREPKEELKEVPPYKVLPAIQEDLEELSKKVMKLFPNKWAELKITFHEEKDRKPSFIFSSYTPHKSIHTSPQNNPPKTL